MSTDPAGTVCKICVSIQGQRCRPKTERVELSLESRLMSLWQGRFHNALYKIEYSFTEGEYEKASDSNNMYALTMCIMIFIYSKQWQIQGGCNGFSCNPL